MSFHGLVAHLRHGGCKPMPDGLLQPIWQGLAMLCAVPRDAG